MAQITSFAEALTALAEYIPLTKQITGKDITLERMEPLMQALGNPERRLKIIHVAGTSGKTSTSYYISSLLKVAGRRVGLTVSPHVDSVTERLQVNLKPVSENNFALIVNEYLEIIGRAKIMPTYFELLVSMAYWYFDKIGVDYVVAETGLGGLHDATNVAQEKNKICVITDIGLDHMHILGNNVAEIASQKAGIIHDKNQVFLHRQPDKVIDVIKKHSAEVDATINILPDTDKLNNLPSYQKRNWSVAYAVYEYLADRDRLPGLSDDQLKAAQSVYIPARMDTVKINGTTFIMDGAHNEQKMTAFVHSFEELYPNQKASVLLSLKQGKELQSVLPLLKPITDELFLTAYSLGQDFPVPSIDPLEIAAAAKEFGFSKIHIEPDPVSAYKKLISSNAQLNIITGSFYLIFQLRQAIKELKNG